MIQFISSSSGALVALAILGVPQSLGAADVMVEASPLAERVIAVSPTDFESPGAISGLRRKLRAAATAVCKEQYPAEDSHYYKRFCVSGSYHNALKQLEHIHSVQLASGSSASAIAVRVRLAPK